jgi:DNA adenine methylase
MMMETKIKDLQPFLKWAGGKRQLIPQLLRRIPKQFDVYYEPFVGGGALLTALQPKKALINDINYELFNCFQVIRDRVDDLIEDLKNHKNDKEYFYEIREMDRSEEYSKLSPVKRASRTIYLNRTCYNGLFRVNSSSYFNVPFGRYKNPKILNEPVLRAVSRYLNESEIKILNTDFEEAVKDAKEGDFIYFDPPYHPISETSRFTEYSFKTFDEKEQIRLKEVFENLDRRGCKVMLSNSSTPFIKNLYKGYKIAKVSAKRSINSNPEKRGEINEALILNY